MPEEYEIRVKGHLDPCWSDWFAGLELTHLEGDETLLAGVLPDQAALHGLLERIRDLNLKLISVISAPAPSSPVGGLQMKTMVVSYSLSGNNEELAASLAAALNAEHVRITESKSRTMITIVLDMLFHRTPKIEVPVEGVAEYDLVLFVGPVWMGQIATPFRACFKELGPKIGNYGFISISGGAEGPNPKLAAELQKRLGRAPVCLIDLHLADLLPAEPAPERKDTMGYRLNAREVEALTERVVGTLQESVADSIPARVEVIA